MPKRTDITSVLIIGAGPAGGGDSANFVDLDTESTEETQRSQRNVYCASRVSPGMPEVWVPRGDDGRGRFVISVPPLSPLCRIAPLAWRADAAEER